MFGLLTWGSAALHPRLYAVARFAGWDFLVPNFGVHPLQAYNFRK
jgi:hypothetical protein